MGFPCWREMPGLLFPAEGITRRGKFVCSRDDDAGHWSSVYRLSGVVSRGRMNFWLWLFVSRAETRVNIGHYATRLSGINVANFRRASLLCLRFDKASRRVKFGEFDGRFEEFSRIIIRYFLTTQPNGGSSNGYLREFISTTRRIRESSRKCVYKYESV